jgi:hypothetical protein
MSMQRRNGFFILPFGIDGEPVGMNFWEYSSLSAEWLEICARQVETPGAAPKVEWKGNLSHIRTDIVRAAGTALITFLVGERVAASALLMSGCSASAEETFARLFVESLNRVNIVAAASSSPKPFEGVLAAKERPLMAVVAWPDETIRELDRDLVRELGLHLAGAFFDGA